MEMDSSKRRQKSFSSLLLRDFNRDWKGLQFVSFKARERNSFDEMQLKIQGEV